MLRRGSSIWFHSLEPLELGLLSAQAPGLGTTWRIGDYGAAGPRLRDKPPLDSLLVDEAAMTDKLLPRGTPPMPVDTSVAGPRGGRGSGDPYAPADRARNTALLHSRFSAFRATCLCGHACPVRGVFRRSRRASRGRKTSAGSVRARLSRSAGGTKRCTRNYCWLAGSPLASTPWYCAARGAGEDARARAEAPDCRVKSSGQRQPPWCNMMRSASIGPQVPGSYG